MTPQSRGDEDTPPGVSWSMLMVESASQKPAYYAIKPVAEIALAYAQSHGYPQARLSDPQTDPLQPDTPFYYLIP